MAAEGMPFPWRWTSGTISTNLEVIWGMSVQYVGTLVVAYVSEPRTEDRTMRKFAVVPAIVAGILFLYANSTSARGTSNWESSIVKDDHGNVLKRFIPVELFTGANWDGKQEITINTPVDIWQRSMHVQAPVSGKSGSKVIVRERDIKGRIYQEFDINQHQDGLEMTYQDRRGRITRVTVTVNKFPLGWWKPGESRIYCDKGNTQLTILDLVVGSSYGIKFHWKTRWSEGESVYEFAPNRGLVKADVRSHPEIDLPVAKDVCAN